MTNSHHSCFCDLAPLYVLNLVNNEERHIVEAELAESPELAEELADLEAIVARIAYVAPPVAPAPDLKARLFQKLNLDSPVETPTPSAISFLARAQEMEWQDHPVPGVQIKILYQDLVKREMVGLLKAEPGVTYPTHCHAIGEDLFMLQGDLRDGDRVFYPGDYLRSLPGSTHAPSTENGCMFFFKTSMDDEYLE